MPNPVKRIRKRRARADVVIDTSEPAAVWMDPRKLKPWPGNPRKDQPVAGVCESIRRYGFGPPLIVRRENNMIAAGHTRQMAALELGLALVPVRLMSFTDTTFVEFALSDNILAEEAKWDSAGVEAALEQVGDDLPDWLDTADDNGESAQVEDTTEAGEQFYLSVRGPVPQQPDAIERLRAALAELPGCEVDVGIA